jgi:hypothetical protein
MNIKKILVGCTYCIKCNDAEQMEKVFECFYKNRYTPSVITKESLEKYLQAQPGMFDISCLQGSYYIDFIPGWKANYAYTMTADEFLANNVPFEPRIGDTVYYTMNWNGATIKFSLLLRSYDRYKIHAASNLIDITDDYDKFVFDRK